MRTFGRPKQEKRGAGEQVTAFAKATVGQGREIQIRMSLFFACSPPRLLGVREERS